jgi:hypothetical protein
MWSLISVMGLAQSSAPFTLDLSANRAPYKAGAKVYVGVVQTNTSDHIVDCSTWSVGSSDLTFDYSIVDETGASLKQRVDAKTAPGSFSVCQLDAGKSQDGEYLLSWLYDLSRPGKYTVQVSRRVSNNPLDGVVKSNTIVLEILKGSS